MFNLCDRPQTVYISSIRYYFSGIHIHVAASHKRGKCTLDANFLMLHSRRALYANWPCKVIEPANLYDNGGPLHDAP